MKKGFYVLCLVFSVLMLTCQLQDEKEVLVEDIGYQQLKSDIALIENVELENLKGFYEQNKVWLEDVNSRLTQYMTKVPRDQKNSVLIELRDGKPETRDIYTYFDSCVYHLRGGYWTYSMTPKMSTRLLQAYCSAGWNELAAVYYYIRNDNGSLSNQYWCHFDAFIEADWDIERGRPLVSYLETILALCNPS